jgi:hypothetical protein
MFIYTHVYPCVLRPALPVCLCVLRPLWCSLAATFLCLSSSVLGLLFSIAAHPFCCLVLWAAPALSSGGEGQAFLRKFVRCWPLLPSVFLQCCSMRMHVCHRICWCRQWMVQAKNLAPCSLDIYNLQAAASAAELQNSSNPL